MRANGGIAAVCVVVMACSPKGGEGWAKEHLGEEGKEAVRSDAMQIAGFEGHLARPGGEPRTYLPRPYVILEIPDGQQRPVYPNMNRRIDEPPASAADVRGIAVMRVDFKMDEQKIRGQRHGHNEYDVFLVDRAARTMTKAHVRQADDVPGLLASLPSSP